MQDRQRLFSKLLGEFLVWIYTQPGYSVVVGEVQRFGFVQDILFEQKKSKTRNSLHEKSLAVDLSLFINGVYITKTPDYLPLGLKWESMHPGNVWGGRFGDRPETKEIEGWDGGHFQHGGNP